MATGAGGDTLGNDSLIRGDVVRGDVLHRDGDSSLRSSDDQSLIVRPCAAYVGCGTGAAAIMKNHIWEAVRKMAQQEA